MVVTTCAEYSVFSRSGQLQVSNACYYYVHDDISGIDYILAPVRYAGVTSKTRYKWVRGFKEGAVRYDRPRISLLF